MKIAGLGTYSSMDIKGIRCINDDTHETEWEIKFNSEAEYKKTAKMMKWVGSINSIDKFLILTYNNITNKCKTTTKVW